MFIIIPIGLIVRLVTACVRCCDKEEDRDDLVERREVIYR